MLIHVALFVLSALGLVASAREFIRRGRTVGLWA